MNNFDDYYFKKVGQTPLLSKEEEKEIGRKLKETRNRFLESLKELIVAFEQIPKLRDFFKDNGFRLRMEKNMDKVWQLLNFIQKKRREIENQASQPVKKIIEKVLIRSVAYRKYREKMINSNLRLVINFAKKLQTFGLSLSDSIQEGNIGLTRAVDRFDPDKGVRFNTYAFWWIFQSIERALEAQTRIARLPVNISKRLRKLLKESAVLEENLGRPLNSEEIKEFLKAKPGETRMILGLSHQAISLDRRLEDKKGKSFSLLETIPDKKTISPLRQALINILKEELMKQLLKIGDARDIDIFKSQYLGNYKNLRELGEKYGVSRERIRQLREKLANSIEKSLGKKGKAIYELIKKSAP